MECGIQRSMGNSGEEFRPEFQYKRDNKDHATSTFRGTSLGIYSRGHWGCILGKNLSLFCPMFLKLREADLKSKRLVTLIEEMTEHRSVQAEARSSLVAFSQVYSERWELNKQKDV